MSKSKNEFIEQYEINKQRKITKGERFRARCTLRNVLATICLIFALLSSIIYIIVAVSYSKYGQLYNEFDSVTKTLGLTSVQENSMLIQMNLMEVGWAKVYKTLSIDMIWLSGLNFVISIVLWSFCPNFRFKDILSRSK